MASSPFVLDNNMSVKEIQLRELISNLLIVLSEKEKYIIQQRFALASSNKATLEEIGDHFGVTRERVRQIEKSALKKLERNAQNTNISILTKFAKNLLQKRGGILSDTRFKADLLEELPQLTEEDTHQLHLALELDPEISFTGNTLAFEPHWKMANMDSKIHEKVTASALKILKKGPQELMKFSALEKSLGGIEKVAHLRNILEISKLLKVTDKGVGLKLWRNVNPRTLKDKICFVLNKFNKPIHFNEITKKIREENFDEKNINVQAVHNELIRTDQFVLIGRGIYALADWGYQAGTVSDVIESILADGKALSRDEIVKKVLERRQVKPITIYLNLKNKSQFARVGRDKYVLNKA